MSHKDEFDKFVQELVAQPSPIVSSFAQYANIPPLNTTINLTDNGKEILNRRYRRRDADGNYVESIEETYMRVANYIASAEQSVEAVNYYTNVFYNFLTRMEFIPNAPTWTGSATPLGQLAACFVLPIEDNMGSHPDGIFSTLRNAALIQQTGGGNGFSFSRVRPRGDVVLRSMGKATGPVGFLEVYDAAFNEIAQGGARRGANMAVLRVDHPDIRDFIQSKTQEGKVKNFNISVAITDKFMEAVKNNTEFELINPRDQSVWETVKAREIFDLIVKCAYANGEPGVLFIDQANRYNPVPEQYRLEATNPCGEQWLGPYENCCLGHINLAVHTKKTDSGEYAMDWEHLARTTQLGTRFLDNVITMNGYVPSVPQLKEAAHRNRRIGLGFTGLADLFYLMNIRYGSEESAEFAAQMAEFIRYHSMQTSVELAQERGPFPGITKSIYEPRHLQWRAPVPITPYQRDWQRPPIDWSAIESSLDQHGIRNSTQMTVAPTGSTSTVLGVEGYGCEPVFALAYYRNVYQAAGMESNMTLTYLSPLFESRLNEMHLPAEIKQKVINEVLEKGTVQHVREIPQDVRDVFVVSADITPSEHVHMQASLQAFIDNSISKTCNFPEHATEDDVRHAYFQAWETKCKGLTVYRTGSRQEVVLETKETKEKTPATESNPVKVAHVLSPRDKILHGKTLKIATPLGNMYLTANKDRADNYHEVFINLGNAGSDVRADTEAMGKLISLIFRLGSADSNQRMDAVIKELEGISSGMVSGFNGERVLSVPDAIAKALKRIDHPEEFVQQTELNLFSQMNGSTHSSDTPTTGTSVSRQHGEMCPLCGNYSVSLVEGCKKCNPQLGGCGEYSAC